MIELGSEDVSNSVLFAKTVLPGARLNANLAAEVTPTHKINFELSTNSCKSIKGGLYSS